MARKKKEVAIEAQPEPAPRVEPKVERKFDGRKSVKNLRDIHIQVLEAKEERTEHEEWVLKQLKERTK